MITEAIHEYKIYPIYDLALSLMSVPPFLEMLSSPLSQRYNRDPVTAPTNGPTNAPTTCSQP